MPCAYLFRSSPILLKTKQPPTLTWDGLWVKMVGICFCHGSRQRGIESTYGVSMVDSAEAQIGFEAVAALEAHFRASWRRFLRERRIRSTYTTFAQRSKGRKRFLSVILPVRDERIIARVQRIQSRLAHLPILDLHPPHTLHLTVRALGFLVPQPSAADEIDLVDLRRLKTALREAASLIAPFDIELRRINSWDTAPFVEAHTRGEILELRATIITHTPFLRDFSYIGGFVPHLSIGYYNTDAQADAAIEALCPLRYRKPGCLRSDVIRLVEGQADDLHAPFEVLEEIPLGTAVSP